MQTESERKLNQREATMETLQPADHQSSKHDESSSNNDHRANQNTHQLKDDQPSTLKIPKTSFGRSKYPQSNLMVTGKQNSANLDRVGGNTAVSDYNQQQVSTGSLEPKKTAKFQNSEKTVTDNLLQVETANKESDFSSKIAGLQGGSTYFPKEDSVDESPITRPKEAFHGSFMTKTQQDSNQNLNPKSKLGSATQNESVSDSSPRGKRQKIVQKRESKALEPVDFLQMNKTMIAFGNKNSLASQGGGVVGAESTKRSNVSITDDQSENCNNKQNQLPIKQPGQLKINLNPSFHRTSDLQKGFYKVQEKTTGGAANSTNKNNVNPSSTQYSEFERGQILDRLSRQPISLAKRIDPEQMTPKTVPTSQKMGLRPDAHSVPPSKKNKNYLTNNNGTPTGEGQQLSTNTANKTEQNSLIPGLKTLQKAAIQIQNRRQITSYTTQQSDDLRTFSKGTVDLENGKDKDVTKKKDLSRVRDQNLNFQTIATKPNSNNISEVLHDNRQRAHMVTADGAINNFNKTLTGFGSRTQSLHDSKTTQHQQLSLMNKTLQFHNKRGSLPNPTSSMEQKDGVSPRSHDPRLPLPNDFSLTPIKKTILPEEDFILHQVPNFVTYTSRIKDNDITKVGKTLMENKYCHHKFEPFYDSAAGKRIYSKVAELDFTKDLPEDVPRNFFKFLSQQELALPKLKKWERQYDDVPIILQKEKPKLAKVEEKKVPSLFQDFQIVHETNLKMKQNGPPHNKMQEILRQQERGAFPSTFFKSLNRHKQLTRQMLDLGHSYITEEQGKQLDKLLDDINFNANTRRERKMIEKILGSDPPQHTDVVAKQKSNVGQARNINLQKRLEKLGFFGDMLAGTSRTIDSKTEQDSVDPESVPFVNRVPSKTMSKIVQDRRKKERMMRQKTMRLENQAFQEQKLQEEMDQIERAIAYAASEKSRSQAGSQLGGGGSFTHRSNGKFNSQKSSIGGNDQGSPRTVAENFSSIQHGQVSIGSEDFSLINTNNNLQQQEANNQDLQFQLDLSSQMMPKNPVITRKLNEVVRDAPSLGAFEVQHVQRVSLQHTQRGLKLNRKKMSNNRNSKHIQSQVVNNERHLQTQKGSSQSRSPERIFNKNSNMKQQSTTQFGRGSGVVNDQSTTAHGQSSIPNNHPNTRNSNVKGSQNTMDNALHMSNSNDILATEISIAHHADQSDIKILDETPKREKIRTPDRGRSQKTELNLGFTYDAERANQDLKLNLDDKSETLMNQARVNTADDQKNQRDMSAFSMQDSTFIQKAQEQEDTTKIVVDVEAPQYSKLQKVCDFEKNMKGNTRKKEQKSPILVGKAKMNQQLWIDQNSLPKKVNQKARFVNEQSYFKSRARSLSIQPMRRKKFKTSGTTTTTSNQDETEVGTGDFESKTPVDVNSLTQKIESQLPQLNLDKIQSATMSKPSTKQTGRSFSTGNSKFRKGVLKANLDRIIKMTQGEPQEEGKKFVEKFESQRGTELNKVRDFGKRLSDATTDYLFFSHVSTKDPILKKIEIAQRSEQVDHSLFETPQELQKLIQGKYDLSRQTIEAGARLQLWGPQKKRFSRAYHTAVEARFKRQAKTDQGQGNNLEAAIEQNRLLRLNNKFADYDVKILGNKPPQEKKKTTRMLKA